MADKITLEIARYSPEQDQEPHFESFEVPVYKEWVVLDALNHIKDTVDGTLTYRWSCRMGICGSCGMMVNGEPKLTCATFLSSYAKNGNKIRVEPLRYFPIVRDLVTELSDFLVKLKKVKPWLMPKDRTAAGAGRVSANPGAGGSLQAVQHVHQLHVVLRRLSGGRVGSGVRWAGCDCAGATLQHGFARPGRAGTNRDIGPSRWSLGLHLRWRMHARLSQARGPGRRDPAVQDCGGVGLAEIVCDAERSGHLGWPR